jgi:hypothetical protein
VLSAAVEVYDCAAAEMLVSPRDELNDPGSDIVKPNVSRSAIPL